MNTAKKFPIYVYHAGFLLFADSAYAPSDTVPFSTLPGANPDLHVEKIALARLALDRARETYSPSLASSPELAVLRSAFDGKAFRVFLFSEEEGDNAEALDDPSREEEWSFLLETTPSEESEEREALGL